MRRRENTTRGCGRYQSVPGVRAFTLVELIVVILLIALAAGLAAPRLFGGEGRRVAARAEAAAEVLSAAARRDALLSRPVAIAFNREDGVLRVLSLTADDRGRMDWRDDAMMPRADLSEVTLAEIRADGAALDPVQFRLVFDQFEPRPALRLVLTDADGENTRVVELAPTAGQAVVVGAGAEESTLSVAQDLDALGKEEEAW